MLKKPVAFILTSSNQGTFIVNRNDYRIVGDGGFGVGYQLLNSSSFDQSECDFAKLLLEQRREAFGDGVVVLDCGANIGVFTVDWAHAMTGWGSVISFEAQERVFYALAGNITLNNCFNARAVFSAIGATVGSIKIPQPNYLLPSSFGSLEIRQTHQTEFIGQEIDYTEAAMVQIPMVSIDSLLLNRVDLIKLDIEGMEMDALEGASKTLESHKPTLIIETLKSDESAIRAFLAERDYHVFPHGTMNILAIHESDKTWEKIVINDPPVK